MRPPETREAGPVGRGTGDNLATVDALLDQITPAELGAELVRRALRDVRDPWVVAATIAVGDVAARRANREAQRDIAGAHYIQSGAWLRDADVVAQRRALYARWRAGGGA